MSATEELIAAEAGKLNLDEKKSSIASASSSASSAQSTMSSHCPCAQARRQFGCYNMMSGCHFAPPPCMLTYWGALCVPPLCYNLYQAPPKCPCKCSAKTSSKKSKPPKEEALSAQTEEKKCACCDEGKCECCKSGKQCGEVDDKASDKNGGVEEGDEGGDEEKEDGGDGDGDGDGEKELDDGHSVAKLIRQFSKDV